MSTVMVWLHSSGNLLVDAVQRGVGNGFVQIKRKQANVAVALAKWQGTG
jgi:hypothetical protein